MNAAVRRAAAGRDDGLLWQFLCLAQGPFLRLGLRFRPRRAQRWSSEERSNPEPRAAPYSEHGEDCEHRTLTGGEHDATIVVGRDVEADQAWVVCRFGLSGGGAAGSGLRRDGPSMRMVMQWCCNRSINASTSGFLSNNPYQSGRSRLVVMIVETRL